MFHCSHLSKQLVPSKHLLTTCRKVKIKPVKRLFSILKVVVQNKIKIQDHVKVETQFIITKVPLIALLSYCNKINATLFSWHRILTSLNFWMQTTHSELMVLILILPHKGKQLPKSTNRLYNYQTAQCFKSLKMELKKVSGNFTKDFS